MSHAKKESDGTSEEEWAYVGTWAVEEPKVLKGMEGDKGLVIKDKAAHHAISAKFAEPLSNKGKTLVAQYEVKLQSEFPSRSKLFKLRRETLLTHLIRWFGMWRRVYEATTGQLCSSCRGVFKCVALYHHVWT